MKSLLTTAAVFFLFCITLSAQTRKIAFESHSGSEEYFSLDLFNEESDFGLPANKTSFAVDSVIKLSNSKVLLVKKMYSKPWGDSTNNWKYTGPARDTFFLDQGPQKNKFYADSFKLLFKQWDLINADKLEKVIFIGFDDKKTPKQKKEFVPVVLPGRGGGNSSPFDGQLIWMISLVFVLSLLGGWISWKFYKPQLAA